MLPSDRLPSPTTHYKHFLHQSWAQNMTFQFNWPGCSFSLSLHTISLEGPLEALKGVLPLTKPSVFVPARLSQKIIWGDHVLNREADKTHKLFVYALVFFFFGKENRPFQGSHTPWSSLQWSKAHSEMSSAVCPVCERECVAGYYKSQGSSIFSSHYNQ